MSVNRRIGVVIVCAGGCMGAAALGQPTFSVGNGGPSGLAGDTIYGERGGPVPLGGGAGSGLGLPGDDMDAYSKPKTEDDFVACGTVDPDSEGEPPPLDAFPPFNVFNQAVRRQHAGDRFIGSEAYNRRTGKYGVPISTGLNQNFLVVNQSGPYPKQFGLLPAGDPTVFFPTGTRQDNVDGLQVFDDSLPLPPIYFSLTQTSPSLTLLGGNSAADIFFDPDPTVRGGERLFVSALQLGLVPADDVDGVGVYDDNRNGIFDGTDQVFFSLSRTSPSLEFFGASPADILRLDFGTTQPQVFLTAREFGLRPDDNLDGFSFTQLLGGSAEFTIMQETPAPGGAVVLVAGALLGARRRRAGSGA